MIWFQTATLLQAQELAHLVNSAYRGEYAEQGWTSEASILGGQRTDAESLSAIIQTPHHQIEMAFDQETQKLIGSVHLIQEAPDTLYFGMLTVEPRLQGKGLGKLLLNHVESVARAYGLNRIRFTVIPTRTELVAFYERRGYKATGRTEAFPENDPKFGLPKVSDLVLKEYEKMFIILMISFTSLSVLAQEKADFSDICQGKNIPKDLIIVDKGFCAEFMKAEVK